MGPVVGQLAERLLLTPESLVNFYIEYFYTVNWIKTTTKKK